ERHAGTHYHVAQPRVSRRLLSPGKTATEHMHGLGVAIAIPGQGEFESKGGIVEPAVQPMKEGGDRGVSYAVGLRLRSSATRADGRRRLGHSRQRLAAAIRRVEACCT